MKSLTDIEVSLNEIEGDHIEITIDAAACRDDSEFAEVSDEDLGTALVHVAGLLGRLAVVATPWLELQRQQHACRIYVDDGTGSAYTSRPSLMDGCGLAAAESMLAPRQDLRNPPGVWLTVPLEHHLLWLERVRNWLVEIAASSAAASP